jgi:hypothetical protein
MRIQIEDVDNADLLIHLPSVCQFIDHAIRSGGAILVHDVQTNSTSCRHRALRINYTVTGCLSQRGAAVVLFTVSVAFFQRQFHGLMFPSCVI